MSKNYSPEVIKRFLEDDTPSIFVLKDDSVYIGVLRPGYGQHVRCVPPTINDGGTGFPKSYIKQIILFNGLVYPKTEDGKHKMLNILELNELVNKAGYEFI